MKNNPSPVQARLAMVAIIAGSVSLASAQTIDTSTGTVLDSSTSRTAVPSANPAPTRLTASILPLNQESKTAGELTFIAVGNAVGVSGSVTGLEPLQRYQAMVQMPVETPASAAMPVATAKPASQAGTPDAGAPLAGAPSAPAPAAGQPDGDSRPGAPGAGAGSATSPATASQTPPTGSTADLLTPELEMGSMLADSNGDMTLNLTLGDKDLTPPPAGILGCTVIIQQVLPAGTSGKPQVVGSGIIVAPLAENAEPTNPPIVAE